jgi:hypothetical protein
MAQQRIYNFGDTLTQGRTKTLASKLLAAGIYDGMEPVIVSDVNSIFKLTAGSFLLPNGVLVVESADVTEIQLPALWPPAAPTTYVLTADHSDIQAIGGSSVSYTLRVAPVGPIPTQGWPSANSLTLLIVRHPGSAPLNSGMFSVPLHVRSDDLLDYTLSESGWVQLSADLFDYVVGPNIVQRRQSSSQGPQHQGMLFFNTAAFNSQSVRFTLPIPRLPWARRVEVYADLPPSSSIGFDTTVRTLTASVAAGIGALVSVNSVANLTVNDRVTLFDPLSGIREVATVTAVFTATNQFNADLKNSFATGSQVFTSSVVTAETGEVLPTSPLSITGPAVGLGATPAGVFEIISGPKPATLGLRVVVPPGGAANGVFIKGFRFLGD